jgi:competence protein ComEA
MFNTLNTLNTRLIPFAIAAALVVALIAPITASAAEAGVVNINNADASTLALLPRVGPAMATRIVEFREENGAFKAVDDLLLVRGIGERTLELMKRYITLEGKTTLEEKVRMSDAAAALEPQGEDR